MSGHRAGPDRLKSNASCSAATESTRRRTSGLSRSGSTNGWSRVACAGTPSAALPIDARRSRSSPAGSGMRTITAERSDRGPSTIRPDIRPRVRSRSAAGLERGEARVDLQLVLVGIERGELLVQRRRRDLVHAPDLRLLAPDLLLE